MINFWKCKEEVAGTIEWAKNQAKINGVVVSKYMSTNDYWYYCPIVDNLVSIVDDSPFKDGFISNPVGRVIRNIWVDTGWCVSSHHEGSYEWAKTNAIAGNTVFHPCCKLGGFTYNNSYGGMVNICGQFIHHRQFIYPYNQYNIPNFGWSLFETESKKEVLMSTVTQAISKLEQDDPKAFLEKTEKEVGKLVCSLHAMLRHDVYNINHRSTPEQMTIRRDQAIESWKKIREIATKALTTLE